MQGIVSQHAVNKYMLAELTATGKVGRSTARPPCACVRRGHVCACQADATCTLAAHLMGNSSAPASMLCGKLHSCQCRCAARARMRCDVRRHGSERYLIAGFALSHMPWGLQGFEAVKALHLEPQQFTVEDELMTPTFKLKRPQLQKKYQSVLNDMYKMLRG